MSIYYVDMDDCTYLLYSHSSYSDVLDINIKQLKETFNIPICVCTNDSTTIPISDTITIYQYDDKLPYASRLLSILKNITSTYVLLTHENNILVEPVDINVMNDSIKFMTDNNVDQLRLFITGIGKPKYDTMYQKVDEGSLYMSIQSTIWRKATLMNIYNQFKIYGYGSKKNQIEYSDVQEYVSQFNNYYLRSEYDTEIEGVDHNLSYYFPVIHFTTLGKWLLDNSINKYYINILIEKYGIDINKRGAYLQM
jgi:hypothetical protein